MFKFKIFSYNFMHFAGVGIRVVSKTWSSSKKLPILKVQKVTPNARRYPWAWHLHLRLPKSTSEAPPSAGLLGMPGCRGKPKMEITSPGYMMTWGTSLKSVEGRVWSKKRLKPCRESLQHQSDACLCWNKLRDWMCAQPDLAIRTREYEKFAWT